MASNQELHERIQAFARELAEEFGEIDDSQALSYLDAVESRAVEIGDAMTTALVKHKLGTVQSGEHEATCPDCSQQGLYKGLHSRQLVTRRGPTTIDEPKYFCPACRRDFFPHDPNHRR